MAGQPRVVYLRRVYLMEDGHGPVNVLAWWDQDPDGKVLVRAAITNLRAKPSIGKHTASGMVWIGSSHNRSTCYV